MIKRSILLSAAVAMLLGVAGCQPPAMPPSPTPAEPPQMDGKTRKRERGQVSLMSSVKSAAELPNGLRVDIYQLQVPLGTISRNADFWKHVDENAVDVATYDLLLKNGVRVGQAPVAEWDYFREIMSHYPAVTQQSSLVAAEAKPVELAVRKEQPSQDLWYFDSKHELQGQSFNACENLVTVTFQQAPRKPNTMRVTLCPVVRHKQKRLEWSPMNNEIEVSYTAPERLYDLNLRTDVPLDNFLIIAPGTEATWPTSIGNNFFVTEGPAERMENILLIIPHGIHIEQVPTPQQPVKATARK